jgi:polar amino acid transport system substrate-binding protein
MKKHLSLLLAAVMLLSLAACGAASTAAPVSSQASASGGSAPSEAAAPLTLKEGILQVGLEVGYPPMEYLDTDGSTIIGFDKEVADAIGEQLGLKVEFIDTAWDGIFSSLDSSRYDCIISSVSITEDRLQNYNLTRPYVANRLVLVTKKGAGYTKPEDLTGLSVAVQTETTSDNYMKDLQAGGLKLSGYYPYDKVIQCFDDLKLGRVDAVMVDSVVAAYYLVEDAETFELVWESQEAEPMGICLKKGNDALTEKIEQAVDALYANGRIAEIATKYFGHDVTKGIR